MSIVRLILRNSKKTPSGVDPNETARQPNRALRMKPKSLNGATKTSQIMLDACYRYLAGT